MNSPPSARPAKDPDEALPSSGVRSAVTLFLLFHLFCLLLVLATNLQSSPLQRRLLALMGPYVQPLKLELTFAPLHLTHGMQVDDDHYFEIEVEKGARAGEKILLPAPEMRGVKRPERFQSLARVVAANAYMQNDANCSEFASAIGAGVLARGGDESAIVRVKRLRFQPYNYYENEKENPADPRDPAYLSDAYQARVWLDRKGEPQVLKLNSAQEVAPTE